MSKTTDEWQVYRSRFLYRARRLTAPLVFVDPLGHEQRGKKGDYLVESDSGLQRIWPRLLFESAHVLLDPMDLSGSRLSSIAEEPWNHLAQRKPLKATRKTGPSCGKATPQPSIPAVNSLRYNI